ncbi:MAG: exosortase-dependent surface protein XDP1 [Thiobacillaceae bacterium]
MTRKISSIVSAAVLAGSLGLLAGAAQANTDCSGGGTGNSNCFTWTFEAGGTNFTGPGGTINLSTLLTSETSTGGGAGISSVATAVSNTGGTNDALASGYIGAYGSVGMGVTSVDEYKNPSQLVSPYHAVDNSSDVESVLFSFAGGAVNLTSFNVGWMSGHDAYTVLAYVGCSGCSATPTVTGLSYSQLLTHGWALIADNAGTGSTGAQDFSNTTYSSYWLIGAYNSIIAGGTNPGDDYFKIASLAGCDCATAPAGTPGCGGTGTKGVPEPGTLLLMSAGFIGLARVNRRPTKLRS